MHHVALVLITVVAKLALTHLVKSLQLMWGSDTRWFNVQAPDLQMSYSDSIYVFREPNWCMLPAMTNRVRCPFDGKLSLLMFSLALQLWWYIVWHRHYLPGPRADMLFQGQTERPSSHGKTTQRGLYSQAK